MPTQLSFETISLLNKVISNPSLAHSRELEAHLTNMGFQKMIFGRFNQKSSIDAASESDRGITERLSNAFDASLTAARRLAGFTQSSRQLTPRIAAQRFLNPKTDTAEWSPQYSEIAFGKPTLRFWKESEEERNRFRKYNPGDGLATVLVHDTSLGIERERMPKTILNLNSDDKLRTFEAIGQFGHGGSSALAFCESSLIISQPRFGTVNDEFYWTIVFSERESEASKQSILRKWFADNDGLPLIAHLITFPELAEALPGTLIWHFGYNRGGWIKPIAGPEQTNPWGRLSRLFFSYPLPFEVRGEFARTDTPSDRARRNIQGAYYRLLQDTAKVEYRSGEKSEKLIVETDSYGQFSIFVFVMKDRSNVRDYIDSRHPVIMTLNGQNHGEMTSTMLIDANLPELASSVIVEIRLDNLEEEALSEIISNSREAPKNTAFTRALKERVIDLLRDDEALAEIERRRQDEKVRQSSTDLNKKIAKFLSSILSDAVAQPDERTGIGAPGITGGGGPPRPEIPAQDPPQILDFLSSRPLCVPEGSAILAKFKSDARPPRYSFHGDNPRCFARLELHDHPLANRLSITGNADINRRGYGSVSLLCKEEPESQITDTAIVGILHITIQCTDGRTLHSSIEVGVRAKPEVSEHKRRQSIEPKIIFCASADEDFDELARLIGEDHIAPFGNYLEKYRAALTIAERDCAYWGEKSEQEGVSYLFVEINAGHPRTKQLFEACSSAEEKSDTKERLVRDIVLDCYQHSFRLEDIPEIVHEEITAEDNDTKRAAEICLNFDKALRIAINERDKTRQSALT